MFAILDSMKEEDCRIFLIGDSLFTESLGQMLAETKNLQIVGTAVSSTVAITAVAQTLPHIIIVANASEHTQTDLNSLLSLYPSLPIIHTDLNQDYVQIITSRRVRARRTDLLAAISELSKQVGE